jgi:NAD(P)-dependent dehydrogenase (short-subunit alcohol dehydrogenase family)
MTERTVTLVTGTSTGIGRATALSLAADGHDVIATLRSAEQIGALEAEAGEGAGSLRAVVLDVTDEAAASDLIEETLGRYSRIDNLINNAGAGRVGTLEQLSPEDLDATMAVNFTAVARMTRLVLPSMRHRLSGRIVSVTSVGGIVGQPFNDAYCAAKFAVEGLMESLAPVAARFGILISVIEPGPVATAFTDNVMPDVVRLVSDDADPYGPLLASYIQTVTGTFQGAQSPQEVADVIRGSLESDAPLLRYQTSPGVQEFVRPKLADLDGAHIQAITSQWIG